MLPAYPVRVAIQSLRQLLTSCRRWLPPVVILLAAVSFGLIGRSAAVVQNLPTLAIRSSASNEADALAADSLATAYGANLSVQAEAAAAPQPQLAGRTVEVNGRPAALLYVSPDQINFLVPAGVQPGLNTVTVRAADGTAVAAGTTNIKAVAPALFTAGNVVAGFALRIKGDGSPSYEAIAEFDPASGGFKTKAIDLSVPSDQVFLVIFLSGIRNAAPAQVGVLLGSEQYTPLYAGASSYPGLDQINLALPTELRGRGKLTLAVKAGEARASNLAEVEIGGAPAAVAVNRFSKDRVQVGETMDIFGANFPTANVRVQFGPEASSTPDLATPDKLTVRVPPGAATGPVSISVSNGVNNEVLGASSSELRIRTSISGVIQDTAKHGVPNLGVSLLGTNFKTTTNQDGAFVLPEPTTATDMNAGSQTVVIAPVPGGLQFPAESHKFIVTGNRDNLFGRLELQSINASSSLLAGAPDALSCGATIFDAPQCPTGSNCPLVLTCFAAGRTPVDLPPGTFSSAIAQITPFSAPVAPAGKLTFANVDNIPAGTLLRTYKLDQTPGSATLGQFVDIGAASFNASGRIETAANAVTEGSYYFVSRQWPTATIIGRVVEADGVRPVRRALVYTRGQSTFTDGNGGYVLRNVPVLNDSNLVTLEVRAHRPDGTVTRAELPGIAIGSGQQVFAPNIILPLPPAEASPTILAPTTLAIGEGESRDFNFFVTGTGATAQTGAGAPSFASVRNLGNEVFALRLAPPAGSAGNYTVTIAATDAQNRSAQRQILVTVTPATPNAPSALSQSVTTAEDSPVNITLASSAANATYTIVAQPLHGALTGTGATRTYAPALNYNGLDSFSFKVTSNGVDSNLAVVAIAIKPVNDPPVLTVPGAQTINVGQMLRLVLTAFDPDIGQTLVCEVLNRPDGASPPRKLTDTSWEFTWDPTYTQAGRQTINFRVSDNSTPQCNGAPQCSDTKSVDITVKASWARTSGPEGATINAFAFLGSNAYAGAEDGVYVSSNSGRSWRLINNGLPSPPRVRAVAAAAIVNTSGIVTGTILFAGTVADGIFSSTDGGLTWAPINSGLTDKNVTALAIGSSAVLAGTPSGVFRSTNLVSWTPANAGLPTQRAVSSFLSTNNGANIFVGLEQEVFVTNNQGANWAQSANGGSSGLPGLPIKSLTMHNNQLHAATAGAGVFRLSGQQWSGIPTNGLPTATVLSVLSTGTALYAGLRGETFGESGVTGGIYQLNSNGQGWSPRQTNLPSNESVNALRTQSGRLFAGLRGDGIQLSTDGASWDGANSGVVARGVTALGVAGNDLYAGGSDAYSTTLLSTDNGQSWTPVAGAGTTGLPRALSITAFASIGATLYAGTSSDGVYRTSNRGQTWTRLANLPSAPFSIGDLAVLNTTLVAGDRNNGVYLFNTQTQTWTPVVNGLTDQRVLALAVAGTTIYAGTPSGVFRSTNSGASWSPINGGLRTNPTSSVTAFAVNDNYVFAISSIVAFVDTITEVYRLPRSNGTTWTAIGNGLPSGGLPFSLATVNNALFVGLGKGFSNTVRPLGVYFSINNGDSFAALSDGLPAGQFVYKLTPKDADLFAGTESGVYRMSNKVQSWLTINKGLDNPNVNAALRSGSNLVAGTRGGGVYLSSDEGQNWQAKPNGLPPSANIYALAVKGTSLFAADYGNGVYRSDNNGQSWAAANSGLTNKFVNALLVSDGSVFAATDSGVYRLADGAGSWTVASFSTSAVRSLAAAGGALLAGTNGDGLFRSTDGGQSWARTGNGLNPYVLALGVGSNALYAGTDGGGVFRSTDNGQNWAAFNDGLPPKLNVYTFSFVSDIAGDQIFLGSIYGVFVRTSGDAAWRQINAGLADVYVPALALGTEKLTAATLSTGMFSSRLVTPCSLRITEHPASRNLSADPTATLSVTAAGDAPLQYQWYRGPSGDLANSVPVAGAVARQFIPPPVTQTTDYWVMVTNGCGSVNSKTATLILNATPQTDLALAQTAAPAQAKPGDNVTFTLTVANLGSGRGFSVALSDALPSELMYVANSCTATGGGVCGGAENNRTVSFAVLEPGASATITLAAKVRDNASGVVRNTASVSTSTGDTNLANNTASASVAVQGTAPTISSLNPNSITAGSLGFALTVNGANFQSGAKVRWNGAERATTFVSAAQLMAQIPAGDIAAAGTATITVANPDGGISSAATFTINQACPTVSGINPTSGAVGSTVTITGANFSGITAVKFSNDVSAQFNVNSETQIIAIVPSGAVTGPITLSKAGCADVRSTLFSVTAGTTSCANVTNLLRNPGAEEGQGDSTTIPGWTTTSNFSAVGYGSDISPSESQRINGGNNYFAGGPDNALSTATQTVSVSNQAAEIDAGQMTARLQAQMAGFDGQGDNGTVKAEYLSAGGAVLSSISIGPVSATNSLFQLKTASGPVPAGTRSIRVTMTALRAEGTYNDAYFDNLLLGLCSASCVSPPSGLLSWLPGDGSANDIQGNHNSTPQNGVSFAPGVVGQAFSFDGIDDEVEIADAADLKPARVTIDAWVKFNNLDSQGASAPGLQYLVFKRNSRMFNFEGYSLAKLQENGVDRLRFEITSVDGANVVARSTTAIAPGQFYHVAGTYDGTMVKLYVNGVLEAQQPAAFPLDYGTRPIFLGGSGESFNGRLNGLLDEVQIFNRALSSSEIQAIYNAGSAGQCKPAPTLSSLSPNTAAAGGAGFTLTVTGTNFVGNSKVRWNGGERQTTFGSATQLTAQIPASDIAVTGTATVTVANPDGGVSAGAPFTVTSPTNRLLRVAAASGGAGGNVVVPIELVSQGDENALGFSLTFDPAVLGNPQAALGSDAAGAMLSTNANQAVQGRVGLVLSLSAGQKFSAGVRQIITVTFAVAANTTAQSTSIGFGDQPIAREVSDVGANVLPADYASGTVTIARGYEADVAPRPDGSGTVTVTDWVQIGRFVSGLDTPASGGEFQRADCAPRDTLGNGTLTVTDWVQAGRYAAGLDPLTPAGGPTAPTSSVVAEVVGALKALSEIWPRQVRLSSPVFGEGRMSAVTIELLAQGGENALGFSLNFDPQQWRFASAESGEDAAGGVVSLNTKLAANGRLGLALALPPGKSLEAGLRSLAVVKFVAAEGGGTSSPVAGFGDWPVARELADVKANVLNAEWTPARKDAARELVNVSAISFEQAALARGSLVAAFGVGLATGSLAAEGSQPPFGLAGTTVTITDSAGHEHLAPLLFVSPTQVNYRLPAGAAAGLAEVKIVSADGTVSIGRIEIAN